jgi:hypothetical protein
LTFCIFIDENRTYSLPYLYFYRQIAVHKRGPVPSGNEIPSRCNRFARPVL